MKDLRRTNQELLAENAFLKQRITELEASESKRTPAAETLRSSEAFLNNIIEHSPAATWISDGRGTLIYLNQACRDLLHITDDEVVGKYNILQDIIVIEQGYLSLVTQVFEQGTTARFRLEYDSSRLKNLDLRKQVSVVLEVTISPILGDDGRVIHAIIQHIDITERKQAEDALRVSEERFLVFMEELPAAVFIKDAQGRLLFANRYLQELFGWGNCVGKLTEDLLPSEVAEWMVADDRTVMVEGPRVIQEKVKDIKGGERFFATHKFPIAVEGKPALLGGISVDITERVTAERDLANTKVLLQAAFEQTPVPMALVSAPDGIFLNLNRACADVLGIEDEGDYVGQSITEINPTWRDFDEKGKRISWSELPLALALQGVTTRDKEIVVVRKDGTLRWEMVNAAPIFNAAGEMIAAFVVFPDITDRKRAAEEKAKLETQLQQAQKMEAIGTLAGGIAHDFNNLLMGIQGYASLSLMNLAPSHPNYERLKRIEEQVQSGADLTRQLLGFARGGRYEVKLADMNDILAKTSSMFGRTKKEISIHLKCGEDLLNVEVDRGQMEQVFMNLYVNAWQAMPGGGEIYLETENVLLNDEQAFLLTIKPGRYVKISVTDTGTGMDEKTRDRIFDPFFTTKEMGRGTGLGLAAVYGIISGHGGMINVDSLPGHGATFTIYLPASEQEVLKEKMALGTITGGREKILLVDDEKIILDVNRELLESIGYMVYAVGSGQEAIAVYMEKRNEVDLVILDMIMPGMSGGDTFDRLREINPEIRVLLSSGYSINGEAQHILDRGCNGFIQKPFKLNTLARSIKEILY
ncbi:MAG: PAS domain S-box protein [Syntrophales bacterium]